MPRIIQAMDKELSICSVEGLERAADPDAPDIFQDPALKKKTDHYRKKNASAYAAVCKEDPKVPELFEKRLQKALAAGAVSKMRDLAAVLLEEGKYGKPTPQQREEMKSTLPVNRPSESGFAQYDYFLHAVINASHFTYSGMAAGRMQGTVTWLESLPESVRYVLVRGAVQHRQRATTADREKMKKEKKAALEKAKLRQQAAVKKAKESRVQQEVLRLRKDERATSKAGLCTGVAQYATKQEKRQYLQLQIRLAKQLGVPQDDLPSATFKRKGSRTRPFHPIEDLQGAVEHMIDEINAGTIQLQPPVCRKPWWDYLR